MGIFPCAGPHAYPPIHSFSTSSGYFSLCWSSCLPTYLLFLDFQWVYFLQPGFTITHLSSLFLFLVGIFPPAGPHSYPPIFSFSTSSGLISLCWSSFLPTYLLFFDFQWVNFLVLVLMLTHLSSLFRLLVGIFPCAGPHTYPPIHYFSTSSGYFSSCLSSLLPTYLLFFCF